MLDKDKPRKQKQTCEAISAVEGISSEARQTPGMGIETAAEEPVDTGFLIKLKELVGTAALGRLHEEDMEEAINEAVSQNRKESTRKMLSAGDSIFKAMKATGLTRAEINEIQAT